MPVSIHLRMLLGLFLLEKNVVPAINSHNLSNNTSFGLFVVTVPNLWVLPSSSSHNRRYVFISLAFWFNIVGGLHLRFSGEFNVKAEVIEVAADAVGNKLNRVGELGVVAVAERLERTRELALVVEVGAYRGDGLAVD